MGIKGKRLSPSTVWKIITMTSQGNPPKEIAKEVGCSLYAVYYRLKKCKLTPPGYCKKDEAFIKRFVDTANSYQGKRRTAYLAEVFDITERNAAFMISQFRREGHNIIRLKTNGERIDVQAGSH